MLSVIIVILIHMFLCSRHYKELVEEGILQEIEISSVEGHQDKDKGMKHFVTPAGVSSLVKYYVTKAGKDMKQSLEFLLQSIFWFEITDEKDFKTFCFVNKHA